MHQDKQNQQLQIFASMQITKLSLWRRSLLTVFALKPLNTSASEDAIVDWIYDARGCIATWLNRARISL